MEKAIRAFDPAAGKSHGDAAKRAQAREGLIARLTVGAGIPTEGIYPGLGERWDRPKQEQVAVRIPKSDIDALAEKVVRGICWIDGEEYIEADQSVDVYALAEDSPPALVFRNPPTGVEIRSYERQPVATVQRLVSDGSPRSSLFRIALWSDQMIIYSSVTPREE